MQTCGLWMDRMEDVYVETVRASATIATTLRQGQTLGKSADIFIVYYYIFIGLF